MPTGNNAIEVLSMEVLHIKLMKQSTSPMGDSVFLEMSIGEVSLPSNIGTMT
jgi:hypothetical protein